MVTRGVMGPDDRAAVGAARSRMQAELLRRIVLLTTVGAGGLALREFVVGGSARAAVLAVLVGAGVLLSFRGKTPLRVVGFLFFCALVVLITRAALDLGGAAGSALAFGFLPGFLAVLTLGPRLGWAVCAAMLASFAWLVVTTELPQQRDLLRFTDEVSMTLFATGLAHALHHSFVAYEAAIETRKKLLLELSNKREAMTEAIYERLEPLSARLARALAAGASASDAPAPVLDQLLGTLRQAKVLASRDEQEAVAHEDPVVEIRARAMRIWLKLAVVLVGFFVVRNWIIGTPFVPSIFTLVFCAGFDRWLAKPRARRHLEGTALAIGLAATGPLLVNIIGYGATPDAPSLVVAPGTVLFAALLSQGRAAWALVLLNAGILLWVGVGQPLTLLQSRLLGDLALSFVVVVVALRSVFTLRQCYFETLLEQGRNLIQALRQRRRLAGTLFHDVSNHLQTMMFLLDESDPSQDAALDLANARDISRRTQRLIATSKGFLLSSAPPAAVELESVTVAQAVQALLEVFRSRLAAKQIRFEARGQLELSVRASRDVLVESVLGNLLSNAIKFSPPGALVSLTAEAVGASIRLVVSDTGPGVPREVLDRLHAEGAVPSRVGTAGEQGQGYGLQLAMEHLGRMGGRLELAHSAERGTEAVVWLPRG